MTYVYYKKNSRPPRRSYALPQKGLAISFFVLGFILLSSVVFPILQFQFSYSQKFNQLQNPLSTRFYNHSGNVLGDVSTDLTQLNNWFIADDSPSSKPDPQLSPDGSFLYHLSIPSQKIQDATVVIGSMDLKKSLIQYPQTALPGQLGNAVIFGHSVLPQFFNPKSYLTIFSTLYRLKQGDEIYVDYDNIKYKYLVEEMYEVKPTDLSILEQRFDGRYLTLITCSPPGTYLRRLVIKAKIVDF